MGHPIICGVGQGVEDHGDSLAEIHGEVPVGCAGVHGNGEECVAVAELVVREACFLRAEEDCDAGGGVAGEFCVDGLRGFAEELERVFQDTFADGGCTKDEVAICYRFSHCREFERGFEDAGGVHGRFGRLERDRKLVDDAELGEAEIVDGAGRSADIRWVAGADEDDDDAILLVGEHQTILGGLKGLKSNGPERESPAR